MWTQEDRNESLAWQAEQADKCPGCGDRLSETTDEDADDAYKGHLLRCHKCRAAGAAAAQFGEGDRAGLLAYASRT